MTPTEQAVEAVGAVARVHTVAAVDGVWRIRVRCPLCARLHTHSGGQAAGTPTLGERVADCHRGRYVIAWSSSLSPTTTEKESA